ncbi:recQ-mediated genome instability protein 1 [Impatiens glandulifera]|uniref:recQ-mediated genome instability protein 1 n=1 Tax=Impatiens glandulifera TaxID=253017 RepID=UPI001FB0DAE1|nr:recQ-mediated genome instability protein 1 [Impatiens glandulifera]
MHRRRLNIHYSSDEDQEQEHPPQIPSHSDQIQGLIDDDIDFILQAETESMNLNTATTISSAPILVDISDDDEDERFLDVRENLSPPSPQPPSNSSFPAPGGGYSDAADCAVGRILHGLGLRLRRQWLDSCVQGLENSVPGFGRLDVTAKAKLCFQQFLFSDMKFSGSGILPENVGSMHLVDLEGPFVLQVDEIVNISIALKTRYQNANPGAKRCLKLSITDGVRSVVGMEYRPIKDLQVFSPSGMKVIIRNVQVRRGIMMLVPEVFEVVGGLVEDLEAARQRVVQEINKPPRGKKSRTDVKPSLASRAMLAAWPRDSDNDNRTMSFNESIHQTTTHPTVPDNNPGIISASTRRVDNLPVPRREENDQSHLLSSSYSAPAGIHPVVSRSLSSTRTRQDRVVDIIGVDDVQITEPIAEPPRISPEVSAVPDIHMADQVDNETPFTYLANLSAKWAATREQAPNVHGKIKCCLTGVKGFQYKQRTMFELLVYIDDGSLISEILIDHNVVQKGIGHSPEEVTAVLTCPDKKRASEMKNTLKQFQNYLVNFEGLMVIRISEESPLPVAIEMNQGCSPSDGWLLLKRLQPSNLFTR